MGEVSQREGERTPGRVWRKPCLRGAFRGRTWRRGGRGKGVSEAGGACRPLGLSSVSHPKPDKCSPRISPPSTHSTPTPADGSSALPRLRSQTWVSPLIPLFFLHPHLIHLQIPVGPPSRQTQNVVVPSLHHQRVAVLLRQPLVALLPSVLNPDGLTPAQ